MLLDFHFGNGLNETVIYFPAPRKAIRVLPWRGGPAAAPPPLSRVSFRAASPSGPRRAGACRGWPPEGMILSRSLVSKSWPAGAALRLSAAASRPAAARACPRQRLSSGAPASGGTAVYIWGEGTENQLGFFPFETSGLRNRYLELSPRRLEIDSASEITALALGSVHSCAINADGELFTWGKGKDGVLGHGDEADQPTPKRVEALEGVKVTQVACSYSHTVALDADGKCYTFGTGAGWFSGVTGVLGHDDNEMRASPTLVESLVEDGITVAAVGAGKKHTAFLSTDGDVFCCGTGEYGRLGNGGSHDQLTAAPVEFMRDGTVVEEMRSGAAFTIVKVADGTLQAFGRNDQGQLGQGAGMAMDIYSMESVPVEVGGVLEGAKVKEVAAGYNHAVAIAEDGGVYLWGMKLHLEPYRFQVLDDLASPVAQVAAGLNYTACVTEDGKLFTMGHGSSNALGHGDRKTRAQPEEVPDFFGQKVRKVFCGERHCAAIVEE